MQERLAALRNLPLFIATIWRLGRLPFVGVLTCRMVRGALPVSILYIAKLVVDEVVRLASTHSTLVDHALDHLWLLIAGEFALAVGLSLANRIGSVIESHLSEIYRIQTVKLLMAHTATLDLETLESPAVQDSMERARRQVSGGDNLLPRMLSHLQDGITISTLLAAMTAYSPPLILMLLFTLIPSFVGEIYFSANIYSLDHRRSPERRFTEYLKNTGLGLHGAKEIKAFGLSAFLAERYEEASGALRRESRAIAETRARWSTALSVFGASGYYAAQVIVAYRTVTGHLSVGDLTFLSAVFRQIRSLLEGLLGGLSHVAGQALYLDDLFSFLRLSGSARGDLTLKSSEIKQGFSFRDVGYRYKQSDRWAVRHLNFDFNMREVVAIVGENGSGKSTLLKLLCGLYQPDEGVVLLDGQPLSSYSAEEVSQHVSVLFQDFLKLALSAADNIGVGQVDERTNRDLIVGAAQRSGAHRKIESLVRQYDQQLGKLHPQSAELSMGEWQKVALARAYMRRSPFLALDEPTASLDPMSEAVAFDRLRSLSDDKGIMIISHKLSGVRTADKILVMHCGEIAETGTHIQLMAINGRYASLFQSQAASYV